jgi:hypothetical protein
MKISNFLLFALLGLLITVVACDSKKGEQTATEETTLSPDQNALTADPNAVASTPSTGTEPHYKCPNNCEGGVGTVKGKCPICGTEMAHNQAFHAQAPAEPGTSPQAPITINPTNATNPNSPVTTQQTMPTEPAQNAKGVWHFACSKNCGGGAGAAGNCPKCGSPLAHNSVYHQQ